MYSRGFEYYQPNELDHKDECGDCVIRAITKIEIRTWRSIFKELCGIAMEQQTMPNQKQCYEQYFREHGYKYTGISNKKGAKRPTVSQFTVSHPDGRYILVVANHLVAADSGKFYDTWDSGSKCLYGYWQKGV